MLRSRSRPVVSPPAIVDERTEALRPKPTCPAEIWYLIRCAGNERRHACVFPPRAWPADRALQRCRVIPPQRWICAMCHGFCIYCQRFCRRRLLAVTLLRCSSERRSPKPRKRLAGWDTARLLTRLSMPGPGSGSGVLPRRPKVPSGGKPSALRTMRNSLASIASGAFLRGPDIPPSSLQLEPQVNPACAPTEVMSA